jgi:NAD(P)-dependent dehydrogenase (short-subunit alcohol dehydrogenase family)
LKPHAIVQVSADEDVAAQNSQVRVLAPGARGLANDVAIDGITANAMLPGLTNTLATATQSEEPKRATREHQAIKRLGEPEDITGAILFLTSDDAAFITGQSNEIPICLKSDCLPVMTAADDEVVLHVCPPVWLG